MCLCLFLQKALKRIVLKAEKDLSSGVSEKAGFTQDTVIGCCLSEVREMLTWFTFLD